MTLGEFDLFGGSRPWAPDDWSASDDRVRGGSSQSYFDCASDDPVAHFYGNLDIKTLGGAGFASQRNDSARFDLLAYDGLRLEIADATKMDYTVILKDKLLPKDAVSGREQATISWEYNSTISAMDRSGLSSDTCYIDLPFADFKPTYRGKEVKDAKPLDLGHIKSMSLMVRSFFGNQEGPFCLSLKSVSAYKANKNTGPDESASPYSFRDQPEYLNARETFTSEKAKAPRDVRRKLEGWFCGIC